MKCITCEEDARAVRQFCGRAACKAHIQENRFVSGYTSMGGIFSFKDNAFSVDNAVWCGICRRDYHASA